MSDSIDTVLFDLDDTLCRYRRGADEVLELAFERAGVGPVFEPTTYYARYREYLERADGFADFHERCFGDLAVDAGHDRADGIAVAREFREERDQRNVEALPGAAATLEALADEYALGLITNGLSAMQRQKLEATGLDRAFETTVFAGEDTAPKPDPEPFSVALDELGSSPERAVYVGNSLSSDVAGARAAGLDSVWVPRGTKTTNPEPRPSYVLESLAELQSPPWR
ncbi:HAD-superfamily hydrolase [Natronococcus amylolyticus DSM 10524]|uniref:HAD-superfamily hydrolase n=1 Tax=Natronococcus amylolyticus DSM 10524 TaxID=1227497 RepID=L9WYW4_9EURY|nr:HAD family hydrolase [Natronococcus amylolyticus]ELY54371.1 HAD-superfamily hydrolase [Natronococcus amylolyticus DSM 10524]